MTLVTNQDLQNRTIPYSQVLRFGFEYLLAGAAKEHSEINQFKNISDFNLKNTIGLPNVMVYPFFVSVANGHSKALFSLFGNFRVFTFGPVSLPILKLLPSDNSDKYSALEFININSKRNPSGIEIIEKNDRSNFKDISALIKEQVIHFSENKSEKFGDILIESDNGSSSLLCDAIDNGISIIKSQSQNRFFNTDRGGLVYQAKYFKAFAEAYESNMPDIITYDKINEPGRPRPLYADAISV